LSNRLKVIIGIVAGVLGILLILYGNIRQAATFQIGSSGLEVCWEDRFGRERCTGPSGSLEQAEEDLNRVGQGRTGQQFDEGFFASESARLREQAERDRQAQQEQEDLFDLGVDTSEAFNNEAFDETPEELFTEEGNLADNPFTEVDESERETNLSESSQLYQDVGFLDENGEPIDLTSFLDLIDLGFDPYGGTYTGQLSPQEIRALNDCRGSAGSDEEAADCNERLAEITNAQLAKEDEYLNGCRETYGNSEAADETCQRLCVEDGVCAQPLKTGDQALKEAEFMRGCNPRGGGSTVWVSEGARQACIQKCEDAGVCIPGESLLEEEAGNSVLTPQQTRAYNECIARGGSSNTCKYTLGGLTQAQEAQESAWIGDCLNGKVGNSPDNAGACQASCIEAGVCAVADEQIGDPLPDQGDDFEPAGTTSSFNRADTLPDNYYLDCSYAGGKVEIRSDEISNCMQLGGLTCIKDRNSNFRDCANNEADFAKGLDELLAKTNAAAQQEAAALAERIKNEVYTGTDAASRIQFYNNCRKTSSVEACLARLDEGAAQQKTAEITWKNQNCSSANGISTPGECETACRNANVCPAADVAINAQDLAGTGITSATDAPQVTPEAESAAAETNSAPGITFTIKLKPDSGGEEITIPFDFLNDYDGQGEFCVTYSDGTSFCSRDIGELLSSNYEKTEATHAAVTRKVIDILNNSIDPALGDKNIMDACIRQGFGPNDCEKSCNEGVQLGIVDIASCSPTPATPPARRFVPPPASELSLVIKHAYGTETFTLDKLDEALARLDDGDFSISDVSFLRSDGGVIFARKFDNQGFFGPFENENEARQYIGRVITALAEHYR
jgi:hypothetical protein